MPNRFFELTDPIHGRYRLFPDVLALPAPGDIVRDPSRAGIMGGVRTSPLSSYGGAYDAERVSYVKQPGGPYAKEPGLKVRQYGTHGPLREVGARFYKKSGGGYVKRVSSIVSSTAHTISPEEFIPSQPFPRALYGVEGGYFMPNWAGEGLAGRYLGREYPTNEVLDKILAEETKSIEDMYRAGALSKKAAKFRTERVTSIFDDIKAQQIRLNEVLPEMELPVAGEITKDISLGMDPVKKYGQDWVSSNERALTDIYLKKVGA